jgi:hypothetical protein
VGYRTTFAVPDILAAAANNEEHLKEQFFSAKEILPTRACTETDYRKLFIDIIGVKNAWLFKATENLYTDRKDDAIKGTVPGHTNYTAFDLNGIYTIKIELDELTPEEALLSAAEKQARVDAVISNVKAVYHCNRNLCEDLDDVIVMENQKVLICADIEISAQADATAVYAELLYQINNYLSPQVKQYSLSEMMALKKEDGNLYRMDEVFEGPVLQHGFITDEDVENSSIRQVIYSSDLISLVMNIDGVVNVKELLLNYCDAPDTKRHEWCLKIADGKKPVLCFDKLAIHFRKDVIPVPVKNDAAVQIFQLRLLQERNAMNKMSYEDRTYDTGTFKDIADYSSVIHHLPLTYGVSNYGLPATADNARRAKAKQLKAYLLFFDQLLADHLSQLANTGELFKVKNPNTASSLPQTYFYQKIKADDVNGVEDIIKNYAQFDEPGQGLSEVV